MQPNQIDPQSKGRLIKMYNHLKNFITSLILILPFIAFAAYADSRVYAVIDLPPYGCEPSSEVHCINTKISQIIADAIDEGNSTIQAFPYPRAVHMFESGKSTILVALMNKRLMKQAHVFDLYSVIFYVVAMERTVPSKSSAAIALLNGADAHKEIASSIDATTVEVNNYQQIIMMLKAHRLDYAIIPRIVYESEVKGALDNVKIVSEHRLPVLLYVNKKESQYLGKIRDAVSQLSIQTSEQYQYLFP
ncbi:hypothetical protein [Rheinheimera sp. 1928-s]|uniref:hypothetical protein n=1 Tax=Rheinheimera sp. 1928-s TaxID=3033803 RepID=UPI002616F8CA|nr:hypothetical protein [Rheinheimera sp. 1928-s]MDF3125962.1 hypothetical protein [Rheinheimera sp. 1928-s]